MVFRIGLDRSCQEGRIIIARTIRGLRRDFPRLQTGERMTAHDYAIATAMLLASASRAARGRQRKVFRALAYGIETDLGWHDTTH